MVGGVIWGRVTDFVVQKTVLLNLAWVHKFSDLHLVLCIVCIVSNEDVIDGPLNPPFFLSKFHCGESWVFLGLTSSRVKILK